MKNQLAHRTETSKEIDWHTVAGRAIRGNSVRVVKLRVVRSHLPITPFDQPQQHILQSSKRTKGLARNTYGLFCIDTSCCLHKMSSLLFVFVFTLLPKLSSRKAIYVQFAVFFLLEKKKSCSTRWFRFLAQEVCLTSLVLVRKQTYPS